MNFTTIGFFVLGLVVLVVGAELLVKGASRLARRFGVSPLVIGLTVVAYGTSAPEMAVTVSSAWSGSADIAVGNVVGSNIFNVLFILGLSALIVPLVVSAEVVRREVPIMVGVALLAYLLGADGRYGRMDGVFLAGLGVAYTVGAIRSSRRESAEVRREYAREFDEDGNERTVERPNPAVQIAFILGGLACLVLGSRWLVDACIEFARHFGVSELVIGLTVVAAGTSLPEVATSITAAVRGERDIAVGNVVGSNIFNVLAVLGVGSLVAPDGIPVPPSSQRFDVPVMIAVSVACLPVFFTGRRINRWEGALFLGYYAVYTTWLVLSARGHAALDAFGSAMTAFVLPLTGVTLAVFSWRAMDAKPRDAA